MMFGCVDNASTSLSANVGFLARISSTRLCPEASIDAKVAESWFALSGSAMNKALNAFKFFASCLVLLVRCVVCTMRAKPVLSFCAPLSTMLALCLSA